MSRLPQRFETRMDWSVELYGVTLVQPGVGPVASVIYPFAALWDCIVRGHDFDASVNLFALVARCGAEEAQERVNRCLAEWKRAGWIEEVAHRA